MQSIHAQFFLRRCSLTPSSTLFNCNFPFVQYFFFFRLLFNFIYHTNRHTRTRASTILGNRAFEPRDARRRLSLNTINIQLRSYDIRCTYFSDVVNSSPSPSQPFHGIRNGVMSVAKSLLRTCSGGVLMLWPQ